MKFSAVETFELDMFPIPLPETNIQFTTFTMGGWKMNHALLEVESKVPPPKLLPPRNKALLRETNGE